MTSTRTRKRESAAERVERLRAELDAPTADLPQPTAELEKLKKAEQAVQANPDAKDPTHPARSAAAERARAAHREAAAATGHQDDQRRAELRRELRAAEAELALEVGELNGRLIAAAHERAAADPRPLLQAVDEYEQLRAQGGGFVRLRLEYSEDLRTVVEHVKGAPLEPGQHAVGAIGAIVERGTDGRPVTITVILRDWGLVTVPLDLVEAAPAGLRHR